MYSRTINNLKYNLKLSRQVFPNSSLSSTRSDREKEGERERKRKRKRKAGFQQTKVGF